MKPEKMHMTKDQLKEALSRPLQKEPPAWAMEKARSLIHEEGETDPPEASVIRYAWELVIEQELAESGHSPTLDEMFEGMKSDA